MGARSVYFNDEMEALLTSFKETDPDFNLTDFVKSAMKGDDTMLTEEQINAKIKGLEYDRAQIDLEIEHLKSVIPFVRQNKVEEEKDKQAKIDGAVEVIINHIDNPVNLKKYAPIQSKLSGKTIPELYRLANEKIAADKKRQEDKEESNRRFLEEIDNI